MKRTFLLAIAIAIASSAAFSFQAHAALQLRVTDTITTVTVVDNGAGDLNPFIGAIDVVSPMGIWAVNTSGATGLPIFTVGNLDLSFRNATTTGGLGTLEIFVSQDVPTAVGYAVHFGGTMLGGGATRSIVGDAYTGAAPFALTNLIATLGPFSTNAFSGDASGNAVASTWLTAHVKITPGNAAFDSSGDLRLSPVPEPATMAIWSLIGGIGAVAGLRRRRKA